MGRPGGPHGPALSVGNQAGDGLLPRQLLVSCSARARGANRAAAHKPPCPTDDRYYKQHGRTAAVVMSKVAPDLVDAGWCARAVVLGSGAVRAPAARENGSLRCLGA